MAIGKNEVDKRKPQETTEGNTPLLISPTTREILVESGNSHNRSSDYVASSDIKSTGVVKRQNPPSSNQGFLYPPDVETNFRAILKRGPKFLQVYADRATRQDNAHNEFGLQAKRALPDYYYVNSGDPVSNKWLRNRSKCARPHSRLSSASPRATSRPTSRQSRPSSSSSSQLPGMENPRCFASEGNNFEIVTPLESMSLSYRSWTASDINVRKAASAFHRLPGLRSVRFGDTRVDSTKLYDPYASLPQSPAAPIQKSARPHSGNSALRPQSW